MSTKKESGKRESYCCEGTRYCCDGYCLQGRRCPNRKDQLNMKELWAVFIVMLLIVLLLIYVQVMI